MITIKVNEKQHQFKESISLQDVLERLKVTQNGIAVAINQNIISKTDWDITQLSNNDNILIITATQGG